MIMGLKYIILHLKWVHSSLIAIVYHGNHWGWNRHDTIFLKDFSISYLNFDLFQDPFLCSLHIYHQSLGNEVETLDYLIDRFFFHFFLKVNSFLGQGIAKWTLCFLDFLVTRNAFLIKFWYTIYKQKYCMRLPRYGSLNIIHE